MKIKLNKVEKGIVAGGGLLVFGGSLLINIDYNLIGGSFMILGANITGWVAGTLSSMNMYHEKKMFNEKFYSYFVIKSKK